jgi:hypothetical protein
MNKGNAQSFNSISDEEQGELTAPKLRIRKEQDKSAQVVAGNISKFTLSYNKF